MRTYGRTYDEYGNATWNVVQTDANGFNEGVYLTTLIQCLQLNPGESPFYANYGVPSQTSLVTQIFPDFYVAQTQSQFAPFFAGLTVQKLNSPAPMYDINVVTFTGSTIAVQIPT